MSEPESMSGRGSISEPDLPSAGLLSFYDRLRERIRRRVERRGGRMRPGAAEALLMVPDVFVFLVRLSLDREVPSATRRLVGGALLYFLVPIDLFPEAALGVGGFVDDLVLACAVLARAFGEDLEPWADRYWNGSRQLAAVLGDVSHAAEKLLGRSLHERLAKLLARRGVSLDPMDGQAPGHVRPSGRA